jgi:spore maturation protein CgeB
MTGIAMGRCKALFSHGQKHDGPNQRVLESMAVGRVLISDNDIRSGMGHLFEPWIDYLPYTPYSCEGLERAMLFVGRKPEACAKIAENAYNKVVKNHLIKHRVKQIMEVVDA